MSTMTASNAVNVQSTLFAKAREYYANEYKEKNLTYDELSAAVVVNIMNCLPRHGGMETSRWAPKTLERVPKNQPPMKDLPKNGYYNNGSFKNGSSRNMHKKRDSNNGSFQKSTPANGSPQDKLLLMSQPLDVKVGLGAPKKVRKCGVNPLANEFVPSEKNKVPAVKGGLATSTYAVEAPGVWVPRIPSPPVARSPDWTKKAESSNSQRETSRPVTPTKKDEYVPPHMRATAEDAINSSYNAAAIETGSLHSETSPKLNKLVAPPRNQPGQLSPTEKKAKAGAYVPPHRRPETGSAKNNKNNKDKIITNKLPITASGKRNKLVTVTNTPRTTVPAKGNTNHRLSQNSKPLALQEGLSKSPSESISSSSGASAWKNFRAIIDQNDRALIETLEAERKERIKQTLNITFKDKWIPAVVENGQRTLQQTITKTVDSVTSSEVLPAKNSASATSNKLQIDLSDQFIQEDGQASAVNYDTTKLSTPWDCCDIPSEEKIQGVKVDITVDVNTEVEKWTKSETKSCQLQTGDPLTSNSTMNAPAAPLAPQSRRLATSWEEFTCGRGTPADFRSYHAQKHVSNTLESANIAVIAKSVKEPTDWNPEVVASKRDDLQTCQASESASYNAGAIAAKEFTGIKSEVSTLSRDQHKGSEFIDSVVPTISTTPAQQLTIPMSEPAKLGEDQKKLVEISDPTMPAVSANPPAQVGWLASTWEEFNFGRGKPNLPTSYRVQNHIIQNQPSHISESSPKTKDLGATEPKSSEDKGKSPVQDGKVAQRQKMENASNQGTLSTEKGFSAGTAMIPANNQSIKENNQPASAEANFYPPIMLHNTDHRAKQQLELESPVQIHAALLKEITDPQRGENTVPLTRTNLMERTGVAPLETDCWGIEKAVSDDGVERTDFEASGNVNDRKPSDIRNLLIREQRGLDLWEGDRAEVDLSYMQPYIKSWASNTPMLPKPIDTTRDEFRTGLSALSNMKFQNPIAQPLSYPDIAGSENFHKARVQTAEMVCKHYMREKIKTQRFKDRTFTTQIARNSALHQAPPVDPNAPTLSCHLRPAEERDIPGITAIYNHYVSNSFIPEDQKPISEQQMHAIWQIARKEFLPFIVAIEGPSLDHNNPYKETVVGYARADVYYGFGGEAKGRSRYLGILEMYTHHQYLRKGIGRSLLDRILCITSTSYLQKGGYEWVIPNEYDSAVYNNFGGGGSPRRWHQLLVYRPIEVNDDPDYEWLKDWLRNRFYFFEVARLRSAARTKPVGGPARWLDVVTFQLEASTPGEFEAFH